MAKRLLSPADNVSAHFFIRPEGDSRRLRFVTLEDAVHINKAELTQIITSKGRPT